jgi:hypothetical protein
MDRESSRECGAQVILHLENPPFAQNAPQALRSFQEGISNE